MKWNFFDYKMKEYLNKVNKEQEHCCIEAQMELDYIGQYEAESCVLILW